MAVSRKGQVRKGRGRQAFNMHVPLTSAPWKVRLSLGTTTFIIDIKRPVQEWWPQNEMWSPERVNENMDMVILYLYFIPPADKAKLFFLILKLLSSNYSILHKLNITPI